MPDKNNRKRAASATIPEILPPNNDWIFKLLFGDKRNEHLLIGLLSSFIDLPEEEYELIFLDTHLKPETKEEKLGILDVKVKTTSGKILNIEIQVDPIKEIGKRISFYKSKLVVGQIKKSAKYPVIQDVICICITNHLLFPHAKEYLNKFLFMNPENNLLFDDIPEVIYTLEIPKLPVQDVGSAVWKWLQFLRSVTKEEFEMLAERSPAL